MFKSSDPFSEREAWLYLFSNLANGIEKNGMPRGQFEASIRYLAHAWKWPRSNVHRFLAKLQREKMIVKVGQQVGQQVGHFAERFIVCNYETYQKPWDSKRDTNRDTKWDKSNERVNESKKKESIPRKPHGIKIEIPAGFEISQGMRTWAKEKAPWADVEAETPAFIDYNISNACKHANWEAAWRNWMRNVKKFDRSSSKAESTSLTNTLWGKMK